MKKLFFITIILLLQSFPSFGKWVQLGQTDNIGRTLYVSYENIKIRDSKVYFFELKDNLTPQTISSKIYMSTEQYNYYDCKNHKVRFFYIKYFDQPMGKGNNIYSYTFDEKGVVKLVEGSLFDTFLCMYSEKELKKSLKRIYDFQNK